MQQKEGVFVLFTGHMWCEIKPRFLFAKTKRQQPFYLKAFSFQEGLWHTRSYSHHSSASFQSGILITLEVMMMIHPPSFSLSTHCHLNSFAVGGHGLSERKILIHLSCHLPTWSPFHPSCFLALSVWSVLAIHIHKWPLLWLFSARVLVLGGSLWITDKPCLNADLFPWNKLSFEFCGHLAKVTFP